MKHLLKLITFLCFLLLSGISYAATFTFDGNITYHNEIIEIDFTLEDNASDVTVWTDSFMSGANFDPITAVWTDSGSSWDLIDENDDNSNLWDGQTWYDSGLFFESLNAGDYKFTITTYHNFANGNSLSDGFSFDSETPVLMSDWSSYGGTYYRVNLDGVDFASNNTDPVPEPSTMLLFALGLLGFAGLGRKIK
jgi:hypothetical protein